LHSGSGDFRDFIGERIDPCRINAERRSWPGEHLAAQLEEDAFVTGHVEITG